MGNLLIIDDDRYQRELFALELKGEGYTADVASNGREGLALVVDNEYDCVIIDIRMPEMDGIETLKKIVDLNKQLPVIIHTAYSHYKCNYLTWIADAYVIKSSDMTELKNRVRELAG